MNKEYMDSRAKHIRFLVGSAMHKAMETLCWCTPSIVKHEGSEIMGGHDICLQSTAEGVTHLYEAIDALQDARRRFSFFEVVQAVLSDPVLKFYTADTRTDEALEVCETEKQASEQTPSAVKAKPEPQPVAKAEKPPVEILHLDGGKVPKPKSTRKQRAFSHETSLFFCKLDTARRKYNKERDRATTFSLSLVDAVRHFRFYARRWSIKLTPSVTQEIVTWLKKVKDCSVQSSVSATISSYNHQ